MCSFSEPEKERDIGEMFRELKADIGEMFRELKADIQEVKADKADKADIRELKADIQEVKADKADIRELKAYMQRLIGNSSAECNVNARSLLDHQINKSEVVEFQLLFANKLPDKIFTRDKIRAERDESIQIKLIDTISRKTVELDPLSSTEIKIEVLDGAFGSDGNENWTKQEFNAKIVRERKGEGSLVKGKQEITLRKGVGIIDDLSFLDNSSWNACGKFRLGARVLQSSSMGQARIKEAISKAFTVRDCRGKRFKKFNDASPLKKIKENAICHTDNNIDTVGYFKQMHRTDLSKQIEEVSCIVDDQKLNAVQVVHRGMQNANNHASSSHGHNGGFSTAEEIVPNLASQPLATPTNGVSGQDSSQSNYNPPMAESSQINNGPHSHFPAEEHVFNAFGDTRPNAYSNLLISQEEAEACNSPTTGPLPLEYPAPYQGFAGMQNANNHASSSHGHRGGFSTAEEIVPNLASQPLATRTNGVSGQDSSQSNYNPPMIESSQINNGPHSHFPAEEHVFNAFDDTRPNAYSNLLISQEEAEACNSPTTGPLPHEYPAPYQGFAGMQNANNHASSSHDHRGGFSTAEEIVPNLASQPLDTSTGYPVNAQGVQSNSNGLSGWNSSQSNYNPPMTESSQINNGPHSHFPAEQHVFNAFDDTRPNAYSISQEEAEVYDNRTAGPLPHEYPVPHQGLAGMHMSEPWSEIVQNDVCDPEWNLSQLKEISNFPPSTNSYSQNNNGLLEQDTVDTPFWDYLIPEKGRFEDFGN